MGDSQGANSALIRRLAWAQVAALAAGGAIALLGLAAAVFPQLLSGWLHLGLNSAVAALACTFGMALSFSEDSRKTQTVTRLMAVATALPPLAPIAATIRGSTSTVPRFGEPMPPLAIAAFFFMAVTLFFLSSRKGAGAAIGDASLFGLGWSILTLVADELFRVMHFFSVRLVSPALVWMLALLSFAAMARRMEHGIFMLFLGQRMSSRIIRNLLPVVLILPFFREAVGARLIATGMVREYSATQALAAATAAISVGFLLIIGYYFRRMEDEIHDLSLRDELTGLYNLRGFRLLAEQALRMSQRSLQPFSVMFVDLDELKVINDELGHAVGSSLLVETADLLRSRFRETDVVGRIGGDEFAVAGQFSSEAIALAAERVAANSRSQTGEARLHPSLSIGHVTADPDRRDSLEDLLARADASMYQQKRRKKQQVMI